MYRSVLPYAQMRSARVTAHLLPGRGRRRPRPRTTGSFMSRSRPRSPGRSDRRRRGGRLRAQHLAVDDDLCVTAITENARAYADFQSIPLHEVGPSSTGPSGRRRSSSSSTTPTGSTSCVRAWRRFGERLYIAKSPPYFFELASPAISKGSASPSPRSRLRLPRRSHSATARTTPSCSSGPASASLSRMRTTACPRADWICPSAEERRAPRASGRGRPATCARDRPQGRAQRPGRLPRRACAQGSRRRLRRAAEADERWRRPCRRSTSCAARRS